MANMTKKQYVDICSKCKNGFSLDLTYFGIWGEKRLTKTIQIDEKNYIQAVLSFRAVTKKEGWDVYNIGVKPYVTIDKLVDSRPEDKSKYKCYIAHELLDQEAGEMISRRNMKVLQALTEEYTEEKILSLVSDEVEKIRKAA